MSWGIRITIVYICFVALIVSMVTIASSNKSELVAKDYYTQELIYQDRIDAIQNEKGLAVSIMHEIHQDKVVLLFPLKEHSEDFAGEIFFFRPSDSTKDLKLKMRFDGTGRQFVNRSDLSKGVYKLCLSWRNKGTEYYKEEIITL